MGNPRSIIVSVTNDLVTDNRVHKICLFLIEEGYDVTLVGRKLKSSLPLQKRTYSTKRFRLFFVKGPLFYLEYTLRLFFYLLFHRADVLLSNDMDTLLPNYLISRLKSTRLVYDSHEYFTEVPELIDHPKKQKIWLSIEEWIFPKLNHVYTVNESIAKLYSEKYKVDVKVIRNVAPKLNLKSIKTREELGIPTDKFMLILQGSGINHKRGAEEAVESMKFIDHACLYIIGGGDVVEKLKKQVKAESLDQKIRFLPKMPYLEMMQYTLNADLGLAIDHTDVLNHKLALPNKFFDYIQAQVPILATDLTEVRSLIEFYKIGYIIDKPLTPKNLAEKINRIKMTYAADLPLLKQHLAFAKQKENWEVELVKLKEIYSKLN